MPGTSPDSYAINAFIFSMAYAKAPVFEAYKDLVKMEKYQSTDYADFEWKYYQFYHGNKDLNLERIVEEAPSKTFHDLPDVTLQEVLKSLNLVDRIILRKVSRNLRKLVDNSNVYCEWIYIKFDKDGHHQLSLEGTKIAYKKDIGSIERCVFQNSWDKPKSWKRVRGSNDATTIIVADVGSILSNPKLEIGKLDVRFDSEHHGTEELVTFLQSLPFQIRVKQLSLSSSDKTTSIPPIIHYLSPKTLEVIDLDLYYYDYAKYENLVESEQWKNAINFQNFSMPEDFPIEKLFHFKRIIFCQGHNLTEDAVAKIRDVLLKSTRLEKAKMHFFVHRHFDIDGIMTLDSSYDVTTRRFSIPETHEYFQLKHWSSRDEAKLKITRTWAGKPREPYSTDEETEEDDEETEDDEEDTDDEDDEDTEDDEEDTDDEDDEDTEVEEEADEDEEMGDADDKVEEEETDDDNGEKDQKGLDLFDKLKFLNGAGTDE